MFFANISMANTFDLQRVAHAGGQIEGKTYTNSYDALDFNLQNGFTYFELDFSFTADNQLVCIHEWEFGAQRVFGAALKEKPSLKQFEYLARNIATFKSCTLKGLSEWLLKNPGATIVTDVKEDNITALKQISNTVPDASHRVIPQIYQPDNFNTIRKMGYQSIIWTLYRYAGDDDEVIKNTERFNGAFAITMSTDRANKKLLNALQQRKIPVYIHTINANILAQQYLKRPDTEIYTDFLSPISNKVTKYEESSVKKQQLPSFNLDEGWIYIPKACRDVGNDCYEVKLKAPFNIIKSTPYK